MLSLLTDITKNIENHKKVLVFPFPTPGSRKYRYIPIANDNFHISFTNEVYNEIQPSLKQSIIMNKFNFSHSSLKTLVLQVPLIIRMSNGPLKQKEVTV